MKAIAIEPGSPGARLIDRPEPAVTSPDDVKLRILRVGICGTDREQAEGGRALVPQGRSDLVIGHEMFGQVVATGDNVTRLKPGDYAVFTVRRGCGQCLPCAMNRSDMCATGKYRERGIWGLDGYQTEYVVDHQQYAVRVPPNLASLGVLLEPLSVVEKAIEEAVGLQRARLPDFSANPDWLFGRRCLVAGLGPIGLLAAGVLRLRGAEVWGLDIVAEDSARVRWLAGIGGKYVDGRQIAAGCIGDALGPMELLFEAAGVPSLQFDLLESLAINGAYVVTGIPGEAHPVRIAAGDLMRRLVLGNQSMVGSVNAAQSHFRMAVEDLAASTLRWGDQFTRLITQHHPPGQFDRALEAAREEIKVVVEWGGL